MDELRIVEYIMLFFYSYVKEYVNEIMQNDTLAFLA